MTQQATHDASASVANTTANHEKRAFSGLSSSSRSNMNGSSHFPQKLKNFFRINSSSKDDRSDTSSLKQESGKKTHKFFPNRHRSTTVASEGNGLDDATSPTAHANPYFAHQGPPAHRHRNEGSIPPSPPDTPSNLGAGTGTDDQATTAGKEELARKLRRVASAPNAQGLFVKTGANGSGDDRPATAELGKEPLAQNNSTLALVDSAGMLSTNSTGLPEQENDDNLSELKPPNRNAMFKRTYSSNSIKARDVEVGPGSFDKIKLIGKGDVGKVYLVREKKSSRLFAMKGILLYSTRVLYPTDILAQY